MGEVLDIITVPNQQNVYYKITSGSLRFQVKGLGFAGIGLAARPIQPCDFWIILNCRGYTTMTNRGKKLKSVRTPNILSTDEFREFWIQWHSDIICLGRDYESDPFIVYKERTHDFKYITFAVVGDSSISLHWKFEMPPLLPNIGIKPVSNGLPQWMPADDQLPDGALIGGYENEMLYIVRASHRGSLTPGKFVPSLGLGFISWGGEVHEKSEFEVLCGYDCIWMPCSNGRVPAGAVEAGYSESRGNERLFVGRAVCNGHLIPGKVQPSHKVCYVPYDEMEIPNKKYEVLVVPQKNIQCTNTLFMNDMIDDTTIEDIFFDDLEDEEND